MLNYVLVRKQNKLLSFKEKKRATTVRYDAFYVWTK